MRAFRRAPAAGIAAALTGLVVLTTACNSAGDGGTDEPRPQAPAAANPSAANPSAQTAAGPTRPPGLAPALYRRRLTATGRPLSEALASIRAAQSMASLSAHLRSAERLAGQAVTTLDAVEPPRQVDAEHGDYVAALRTLSTDLTELEGAVGGEELCAASSTLSRLGSMRSIRAIPAAARALRLKGYPTALSMPATPPRQTRRLGTGAYTRAGARTGLGHLEIRNNGSTDAVVSLVVGRTPAFAVYVRGGADFTVTGVDDGTYDAYFTTGNDWDAASGGFTRSCNFTRYDDTFPFTTTSTTSAVWTITLEEVVGGNASTSEVDPRNYPGG